MARRITEFSCLTFDCFGTLVDWESGIFIGLHPLRQRLPESHPFRNDRSALLKAFNVLERKVQEERPSEIYSNVLASAYGDFAQQLGIEATEEEKAKFGAGVGDWPAYPDTVEALKRLKQTYKLVILSNVDRESFARTLTDQLTGIDFDAIYTAQDIGSYKPDVRNFDYLIKHCNDDLGVKKEDILHTAQSLHHDHEPAKKVGLTSAWIERGRSGEVESVMGGDAKTYEGRVSYTWHFSTMGEMADYVESQK